MTPRERENLQQALSNLGFSHKTHLTRQEIDKLVQELSLSREYQLADKIQAMDPAAIAGLLR